MKAEDLRESAIKAMDIGYELQKIIVERSDNVGEGLLAGAFALIMVAKLSPRAVSMSDLVDLLGAVDEILSKSESEAPHGLH